ncbi:MAG: CDP-glycerol glycerophosphotransferase family protein [Eubacteriales bacterium]|nr:CDP-glycerol glycerophosphotransferase family protein [Eubacteriales bacterium]MDO4519755.1 CDP-glycerol glycerophosphotransferase family protein [Eubacteriales bacterium]
MPENLLLTDDEIMKSELPMSEKRLLLMKKYNVSISEMLNQLSLQNSRLYFHENNIFNLKSEKVFEIDLIEVENNNLVIEGKTNLSYFIEKYTIEAVDEARNKVYKASKKEYTRYARYSEDGMQNHYSYECRLELPLYSGAHYHLCILEIDTEEKMALNYAFNGYYSRFTHDYQKGYIAEKSWIVHYRNKKFCVGKYSIRRHLKAERIYAAELKEHNVSSDIIDIRKKVVWERIKQRCLGNKEVWIIADRAFRAGDNGEALFEYVTGQKQVKAYFVIDKGSTDYKRMAKIGPVIDYGTNEHKVKFLSCDKWACSSADGWVFNLMKDCEKEVKDLYQFKYSFLQHGITTKDFSGWLHKTKKHIRLLCCASNLEYDSIVHGKYGYTEKEVKLTGFARFDKLENHKQKVISVMPTWRKNIAAAHVSSEINEKIFVRGYSESFRETEYYKFYQGLISSPELINAMKQKGYRLNFYMHPSFEQQEKDFIVVDDCVEIKKLANTVYKDVFAETALMVTDYSSIAFDYSYLKKPIVYSQFDPENYFFEHTGSKGEYDYETMGFGPVCGSLDETIQKMIKYLESDCEMEDKYVQRVEQCFKYTDRNNCKRIFEALLEI